MDLQYLKKLIKIVTDSEIDELEIKEDATDIRIVKRNSSTHHFQTPIYLPAHQSQAPVAGAEITRENFKSPTEASVKVEEVKPIIEYHQIRSPIVGTFYRAPSPDAEAYVQVGQSVKVGAVLCIIEAMKLMNEITSDIEGKIIQILVENGKPVEYNQPLFVIDPS